MENQDLILKLHDYEMVYAIEELSKKLQNPFSICDLNKQLEIGSMLDISVNQLIQSVLNKDLSSLRLGVIQMTVSVLKIGYLINARLKERDVKNVYFDNFLYPKEDYTGYSNDIYDTVNALKCAISSGNVESVKQEVTHLLSRIYFALPEFSRFSIHDDLIAVIKSQLLGSKTTLDVVDNEKTIWSCYKNVTLKGVKKTSIMCVA